MNRDAEMVRDYWEMQSFGEKYKLDIGRLDAYTERSRYICRRETRWHSVFWRAISYSWKFDANSQVKEFKKWEYTEIFGLGPKGYRVYDW